VKKNAILMIDFAVVAQRDEKLSPREAIYKLPACAFAPFYDHGRRHDSAPAAHVGNGTAPSCRHPLGVSIVGGLW